MRGSPIGLLEQAAEILLLYNSVVFGFLFNSCPQMKALIKLSDIQYLLVELDEFASGRLWK